MNPELLLLFKGTDCALRATQCTHVPSWNVKILLPSVHSGENHQLSWTCLTKLGRKLQSLIHQFYEGIRLCKGYESSLFKCDRLSLLFNVS